MAGVLLCCYSLCKNVYAAIFIIRKLIIKRILCCDLSAKINHDLKFEVVLQSRKRGSLRKPDAVELNIQIIQPTSTQDHGYYHGRRVRRCYGAAAPTEKAVSVKMAEIRENLLAKL